MDIVFSGERHAMHTLFTVCISTMHDKENTKAYSNISYVVLSGILDAHGCGHQMLLVVDF
jgi:hypothetical protein